MYEYQISIETQPDAKQVDFVNKQLREFNVGKIGDYQYTPLFLFVRDWEQKVVGGLDGFMGLGWLHIGTLWIAEQLRGCGYGRLLLLTIDFGTSNFFAKSSISDRISLAIHWRRFQMCCEATICLFY